MWTRRTTPRPSCGGARASGAAGPAGQPPKVLDPARTSGIEWEAPLAAIYPPRTPLLLVLSGPSGVGKDVVLAELSGLQPHLFPLVTVTSRPRRPGEVPGLDYQFVSAECFQQMERQGEFLETALIFGHHYGTPLRALREALAGGRDVILKIDTQGAAQVRRRVPGALLIFLMPPSLQSLMSRLRRRQAWGPGEVEARIQRAQAELAEVDHYDYVVVNVEGHPEEAAGRIRSIAVAEKQRVHPRQVKV